MIFDPDYWKDEARSTLEIQEIFTNDQLINIITKARQALLSSPISGRLFRQNRRLVFLIIENGKPFIHRPKWREMRSVLLRIAKWLKITPNGSILNSKPPRELIDDMLDFADPSLPELFHIAHTPFFAPSGELVSTPGYHEGTQCFYWPDPALESLHLPTIVTKAEIDTAREILLSDLLIDFPFKTEADRAHAIAALLHLFVRRMIIGPTPLHLTEASAPRSGKGLLVNGISQIALGENCTGMTLAEGENQISRQLVSALLTGRSIMFLDNFPQGRVLGSATLASILTSEMFEDRKLLTNQMITVANRALWLCTANTPLISNEMVPRCVRIRLVPGIENPSARTGFKHADLLRWTRENRAELVRALLILVKAWIQAGMPSYHGRTKGAFEDWTQVMGGILEVAGIPGFLENEDELRENADEELEAWREFVTTWHERFDAHPVLPNMLTELCMREDLMLGFLRDGSPRSRQTQMGRLLKGARDRVFGGFRIVLVKNAGHRGQWYRLAPVHPSGQEVPQPRLASIGKRQ
ncbi:MAG: hypothetical protein C4523_14505 [Myxococcales bacterium]|nr:MAG: hypothetical protein C4523_14505 [Myxococcales bacterium]